MSTILKEEESVSYQVKKNLPYKIEVPLVLLEYVGESTYETKTSLDKTELIQVRSFLNRGIVITSALTAFLSVMTVSGIFEKYVSVPLLAVCSSVLLALSIERRKKRI